MDPLSIITSSIAIAGTVGLTLEIIQRTFKANGELTALHNEISDLRIVLGELQNLLFQRAALQEPFQPSANMTKCVHSAKSRLETIAQHVATWKDAADYRNGSVDYRLLKALRVAHKAQKFKEELKDTKNHLTSVFTVLSVSSSSRIELDVKQILLLSEKNKTAQEEIRNDFTQYLGSNMIPRIDPSSPANESQTSQPLSDNADISSVRAFRSNGPVLFESSQMTAVSAVGVRVAQFPRMPCTPWCSCKCHTERQQKTPSFLNQVLGALFIGYSGLPYLVDKCDQASCHLRAQPFAYATYIFPTWFLSRAISFVLTTTPLAGPTISLKVHRTVPGDAEIFTCAKLGDVTRMKQLFEKGLASPFDIQFDSGVTALHYATNYQHIEICALLLQCNADPFWEDRSGTAAADNAWGKILSRNLPPSKASALKLMFSETECLERRDFTVLHKIVVGLVPKDLELELSASTADIDCGDCNGRTPLSFAAQRGDATAVSLLLRFGADVSKSSNCGNHPLHHAAMAIDATCIEPLLSGNADVNALTGWRQTPLHYVAAYKNDADRARQLLAFGADPEICDLDGMTPLDWTAISGNSAIAQALLARQVDVSNKDNYGNTVIVHAVSGNRHQILEMLTTEPTRSRVEASLDPLLAGSVLEAAAKFGDSLTIDLLIRARLGFIHADLSRVGGRDGLIELINKRGDMSAEFGRKCCALMDGEDEAVQNMCDRSDGVDEDSWQDASEYI